ncbi:MAG TPA: hypothetical protein VMF62_06445 [Acetobacteraceae bacterium]|jgi:hypothetical protein|nr:hypothetical protein [Acetobacteraceae bacterium]
MSYEVNRCNGIGEMAASGKVALLLWLAIALSPVPAFAAKTISLAGVPHYATLAAAQKSCGKETVVWANLRTDVYHLSGSRWFGKTKKGAYFCENAVTKAGVHASKE